MSLISSEIVFPSYPPSESEGVSACVKLPDDVIYLIFQKLSKEDLVCCSRVCRRWYSLSRHNHLWRPLFLKEYGKAPRLDVSYSEVFSRCLNSVLWFLKWKSPREEKVLAFAREGALLVYHNEKEFVSRSDLYSDRTVVRVPAKQRVNQISIVEDQIIVAGGSNSISMRNVHEVGEINQLDPHSSWTGGFYRSDKWLSTWSTLGQIFLRDSRSLSKISEINLESSDIRKIVCWGSTLVISYTLTPRLTYRDFSGNEIGTYEFTDAQYISDIATYQDFLVIARREGNIEIWDEARESMQTVISTNQVITVIEVDFHSLLVGGFDGTVSVWSMRDFSNLGSFEASTSAIKEVKRTADELTVLDEQGTLSVFQLSDK